MNEQKSVAAQPNLNATKMRTFRFKLPPVEHQERAIQKLHKLVTLAQRGDRLASDVSEGRLMLRRSVLEDLVTKVSYAV